MYYVKDYTGNIDRICRTDEEASQYIRYESTAAMCHHGNYEPLDYLKIVHISDDQLISENIKTTFEKTVLNNSYNDTIYVVFKNGTFGDYSMTDYLVYLLITDSDVDYIVNNQTGCVIYEHDQDFTHCIY